MPNVHFNRFKATKVSLRNPGSRSLLDWFFLDGNMITDPMSEASVSAAPPRYYSLYF